MKHFIKVVAAMLLSLTFVTLTYGEVRLDFRPMTENELTRLMKLEGVYQEGVNYNVKINGFGTGLRPPTLQQWQELAQSAAIAELKGRETIKSPSAHDNSASNWFPPIGNQDGEGSCVSWAAGYYTKTFQEAYERNWDLSGATWEGGYYGYPSAAYQDKIFSPDFIYHQISGGEDNGSYYSDNLNILKDMGAATWQNMPYDPNQITSWPSEAAFREAPIYRSATGYGSGYGWLWINDDSGLEDLKLWLADTNLAIISIDANQYSYMEPNDLWTLDNYTNNGTNHANTVVGYDDNFGPYLENGETRYGAFKIANSWGESNWENVADGFLYISYETMKSQVEYVFLYENEINYQPQLLAVFNLEHSLRGENQIRLGMGDPANPLITKLMNNDYNNNGGNHPFGSENMALDITEFLPHYTGTADHFFITVYDTGSTVTGTIREFSIEYYTDYENSAINILEAEDTPIATQHYHFVTSNIFPEQDNDIFELFDSPDDIANWRSEYNGYTTRTHVNSTMQLTDGGWTLDARRDVIAKPNTFFKATVKIKTSGSWSDNPETQYLRFGVDGLGDQTYQVSCLSDTGFTSFTVIGYAVNGTGTLFINGQGGAGADTAWVDEYSYDDNFMPDLTTISTITEAKAIPDGEWAATKGVVTATTIGAPIFIQDESAGLSLYDWDFINDGIVKEGDEILVIGERTSFQGLVQLRNSDDNYIVLSENHSVEPTLITAPDLDSRAYQGMLVKLEVVDTVGTLAWPAEGMDANINLKDVDGNEFIMRIDADGNMDGAQAPAAWPLTLVGVVSDFNGPQVMPRYMDDIMHSGYITFQVNMNYWLHQGKFNPNSDFVDIAGSMNNWGGGDLLTDNDGDNIYEITMPFIPGEDLEFKFRINGSWDDATCEFPSGGPNRSYTVPDSASVYYAWYNDEDGPFTIHIGYNMASGWNLISLPLDRDGESAHYLDLFPEAIENTLYRFDGSYVLGSDLIAGEGYWLRFPEAHSYSVEGLPITNLEIPLTEGWNMIGSISEVTHIGEIIDSANIIIPNTLYGYAGSYNLTDSLKAGEGYWIRANAAGSITIGAEGKSMAKSSLPELAQYPTLTFENGQGLRQSLSFAVELPKEINLLSYSLPPVAPKAVLDVRFDGDLSILSASEGRFTLSSESAVNLTTSNLPADKSYQIENLQTGEIHPLENSQISLSKGSYQLSETIALPMEFIVEPNYPNPFNPVTNIRYGLPEASQVSIQIFNVQGQLVRTLFSAEQPAGYHTIQWNGRNDFGSQLGSGVYFYRVQSGKDKMIKKMLLVK
jgi:hypothetical protein